MWYITIETTCSEKGLLASYPQNTRLGVYMYMKEGMILILVLSFCLIHSVFPPVPFVLLHACVGIPNAVCYSLRLAPRWFRFLVIKFCPGQCSCHFYQESKQMSFSSRPSWSMETGGSIAGWYNTSLCPSPLSHVFLFFSVPQTCEEGEIFLANLTHTCCFMCKVFFFFLLNVFFSCTWISARLYDIHIM